MKKRVLILFSGGTDSSLLLLMAKKMQYDVFLLIINYGQVHQQEISTAVQTAERLKVDYSVFRVPLENFVSSALLPEKKVYENVSPWHVPGRNLLFVSIAYSFAESREFDEIWIGANYEDRMNQFPDCYQEWVYSVNKVLQINGSRPVKLVAPLLGMEKELINQLFDMYNESKQIKTFSGYGTENE